jgi:hypothetical protein
LLDETATAEYKLNDINEAYAPTRPPAATFEE